MEPIYFIVAEPLSHQSYGSYRIIGCWEGTSDEIQEMYQRYYYPFANQGRNTTTLIISREPANPFRSWRPEPEKAPELPEPKKEPSVWDM